MDIPSGARVNRWERRAGARRSDVLKSAAPETGDVNRNDRAITGLVMVAHAMVHTYELSLPDRKSVV